MGQLEHYFSDDNLAQDAFFHDKISEDTDGWLDASYLLGCPRVERMGATETDIEVCAASSPELETRRCDRSDVQNDGESSVKSVLKVRRSNGRQLPPLFGGQPSGWLAAQIAERQRIPVEGGQARV